MIERDFLVPYDLSGNLLRSLENQEVLWRPNDPFTARLSIIGTNTSAGNSFSFVFLDEEGHRYPMFKGAMCDLMRREKIIYGRLRSDAIWHVRRFHGKFYGIELYG